jgi:hypothetical protein
MMDGYGAAEFNFFNRNLLAQANSPLTFRCDLERVVARLEN